MLKLNEISLNESALLEELDATQMELFVMNEAEEVTKQKSEDGFWKKLKDFFINIAKKIKEVFLKFMSFFTSAFNKLVSRVKDVERYALETKANFKNTLSEPYEFEYTDEAVINKTGAAINSAGSKLKDSEAFESEMKVVSDLLADMAKEGNSKKAKIGTASIAHAFAKNANGNINSAKKFAADVKSSSQNVEIYSKAGIKATGKKDKAEAKKHKELCKRSAKLNSSARRLTAAAIKDANKVLVAVYSACKKIRSAGKKASK